MLNKYSAVTTTEQLLACTVVLPPGVDIRVFKIFTRVAHFVEALRYKSEGRGFDSRRCHWNLSLTRSFQPRCGPGVGSAS